MAQTQTQTADATAHAEAWVEAKADEREAQKVLDAAKARRKAAADALLMLGFDAGDTVTVYGNRRMEFTLTRRVNKPYKAALDAVTPTFTLAQRDLVERHLDEGATVTLVTGLRNAR